MQTTLLGIAITLILALLAALVGPLLIDWGSYRSELETHVRALTGLEVRVIGAIDARLLPTPSLTLHGIELGRPNDARKLSARALRVEFALGPVMRGEWRIAEAELESPEFAAELDDSGRLAWPIPNLEFRPEGVTVERLSITDGRAVLSDAASGSRLVLDRVTFTGELRSLVGPIKGEGSLVAGGEQYSYRISTSRIADDSSLRVRLAVDPRDHPLTAEADVSILVDRGTPRFEGSLQLARLVGRAPVGSQALIIEPWRLATRIKGGGGGAQLEQIEFQYGPDERATKLRGSGSVTFGRQPQVIGTLSSPQIDVDRLLALPESARRRPIAAIKALADRFKGELRLPLATALTLGVDTLTLGGSVLQRVATELRGENNRLEIGWLEFRAPGATQVRLEGRLGHGAAGINFEGLAKVASNEPRALLAWLADRSDLPILSGAMRLDGEVAFTEDGFAIDQLDFELDRMIVSGRLQYGWPGDHRPARLDAALNSPGIDLDRAHAVAKAVLGDASLDWPREGALTLAMRRVSVAGVEAREADVDMLLDSDGIEIKRLAIAELDGATLTATGRIGTKAQAPQGAVTVDLDARALDGVLALVTKIAPQAADSLEQVAGWLTPVRMRASLAVAPRGDLSAETNAKFKVAGHAGALRVALHGEASAAGKAFKIDNLAALAAAKAHIRGEVDADDGSVLAELIGLDRLIAFDSRPGRLSFAVIGPLDGQLALEARLAAGALDLASHGTIRLPAAAGAKSDTSPGPSIGVALKIANANLLSPRSVPVGQRAEQLPASLEARLAWSNGLLSLTNLKGTIAGTSIGGRLGIDIRQQPMLVDGDIELGAVQLPSGLAALIGLPAAPGADGSALGDPPERAGENKVRSQLLHWPAEPFEQSPLHRFTGQIAIRSARVALAPKLAAAQVRAVLRLGPTEFGLRGIDGNLAGGQISGDLLFIQRPDGLGARLQIRLSGANAADLLPGEGALAGRMTLEAAVEGAGRSAVALIGSLEGSGTVSLENARLARLDPAAFDAIIRAVERGLPIDAGKVKERMELALAAGSLGIPLAHGRINVSSGQARLSPTSAEAQGADLAVNGSADMARGVIDARLVMSGAARSGAAARPEITIALKGPIEAPRQTIDVAVLTSWLALLVVEQQSKKLDVLEGRAPPTSAVDAPAARAPAAPVEPKATGVEPEPARSRPVPRSAPRPRAPVTEQAPALPPPIDIRPAPSPPRAAPHQGGQAQHPKPPVPTRPRSLSEILFGN